MTTIDFSPESGIRNVLVEGNDDLIGNINKSFQAAKNITFLAP